MRPLRTPLPRRTLLKGAGAALALPWLEAMAPSPAAAAPLRYVSLFAPNGMLPSAWRPKGTGEAFEWSATLEPFAAHRDRVLILGNLFNKASRAGEGHYVKTTAWLSGAPVHRTGGRDLQAGTSIDQVLADRLAGRTPIDSLVLGIEPVRNRVDMGYSTVYGANVSWRTPTQPAPREIDPRRAYERLARWSGAVNASRSAGALDVVLEEARALRGRLGGADRAKLEEYLESVRALEERLSRLADAESSTPEPPAGLEPGETHTPAFPERVRLMLDIIVEALRTDSTRVATLMFGNSVSGQSFSFLEGVEGGHHGLSHHENKPDRMAQYARINRWHAEQAAYLVGRLAEQAEAEGTLLDRTVVQFGSGLADGNRHDPNDLPILVAGGPWRGGRHLRQPRLTPLCNFYAELLGQLGGQPCPFGDSSGPLAGL
jgi:hypothetical protein